MIRRRQVGGRLRASARPFAAALVAAAALALIGGAIAEADFTATEGSQFSGPVAAASCASGSAISIDWGDGSSSSGSYDGTSITGTHTYAEEGTYSGTATCGTTSSSFTATVDDASLTAVATSFSATAGQQFSGVVANFTDADPAGTASDYVATIDWGDGSSSSGTISPSGSGFAVTGSHTYSTPGDMSVTVTITDQSTQGGSGGASNATTSASGTAHVVSGPAKFKQCPPVGSDTGCQFLIVVTNKGATVLEDLSQPPYENSDDSLVGIQNNSSKPIQAIPMSAPALFSFEEDGICDPGSGPIPSGCRPAPGVRATCGPQSGSCSFPAPIGQPPGYKEPGALSGNTQNGYEGPTTWFSNVSPDASSGRVNFSPAVLPGRSTYFGLEQPPSASSLHVGKPGKPPPPPPPVLGKSFDFAVVSGTVFVRLPHHGAGFVLLTGAAQLPTGTQVNALHGKIKLTAAVPRGAKTQNGIFGGAIFNITQSTRGAGLTTLQLLEALFRGAPSYATCRPGSHRVLQTLHASDGGHFRSRGHYASATVRGTIWDTSDRCDGTLVKVKRGIVLVDDFVRHIRVLLRAGHQYLAKAPRKRR